MSDKFDEIISLGREWEGKTSKLISNLKDEIRDSDDEDFEKILRFLEETYQLLPHFKLATRDDVYLARILKGPPVLIAGEIIPPSYGQRPTVSIQDIENRLSQLEEKFEEMKDETDKSKKKSEYLFKAIGYAKDLSILIEKVKEYIG